MVRLWMGVGGPVADGVCPKCGRSAADPGPPCPYCDRYLPESQPNEQKRDRAGVARRAGGGLIRLVGLVWLIVVAYLAVCLKWVGGQDPDSGQGPPFVTIAVLVGLAVIGVVLVRAGTRMRRSGQETQTGREERSASGGDVG